MAIELNKKEYLDLYKYVKLARRFGEKVVELGNMGEIPGFLHPAVGMEALRTGIYDLDRDQIAINIFNYSVYHENPGWAEQNVAGKFRSLSKGAEKFVKFHKIVKPNMDNYKKYRVFIDNYIEHIMQSKIVFFKIIDFIKKNNK